MIIIKEINAIVNNEIKRTTIENVITDMLDDFITKSSNWFNKIESNTENIVNNINKNKTL